MQQVEEHTYDVSISIVNYFSEKHICECIQSIIDHTSTDLAVQIIIVSNSPFNKEIFNTSCPDLPSHFDMELNQLEENHGFAKANNYGLRQAGGKYVFILNPDTRFLNNVISILIRQIREHSGVGIIGPSTYNEKLEKIPSTKNDQNLQQTICTTFPFFRRLLPTYQNYANSVLNTTQTVPVVNGSALFLPKNLFEQLGGLDERFFMYYEEDDLCLRARERGYKILYSDEAKILHEGGATTSAQFYTMEIERHRSLKKYLLKHHPNSIPIHRFLWSFAYLWRLAGALILGDKKKSRQFKKILFWYLFNFRKSN